MAASLASRPISKFKSLLGQRSQTYDGYREVDPYLSPLCDVCSKFVQQIGKRAKGTMNKDYQQFRDSAEQNTCRLCWMRSFFPTHYLKVGKDLSTLKWSVDKNLLSGRFGLGTWDFHLEKLSKDPSFDPNHVLGDSGIFRDPSTFGIAKAWIHYCEQEHRCIQRAEQHVRRLPTRLVDVENHSICLTDGIEPANSYLTLSHCWGPNANRLERHRLLKTNIQQFMEKIPMSELPATLRDAIVVTSMLGVRYIWIDSLCIIQDCDKDWNAEAPRMADIYQGSLCNLAALEAASDDDGMLNLELKLRVHPCRIKIEGFKKQYLNGVYDVSGFRPRNRDWYREFNDSCLHRRAWVIQELTLAPRTLYFTHDQLYWQCGQLTASDKSPTKSYSWSNFTGAMKFDLDLSMENAMWKGRSDMGSELDDLLARRSALWVSIIQQYTSAQLSYPERDLLMGVAGMAKILAEQGRDEYMAGMWRSSFAYEWCWYKLKYNTPPIKVSPCQAPSWSWAARNGAVGFPSREADDGSSNQQAIFRIVNYKADPIGSNLFGNLKSAELKLEGTLFRLRSWSDRVVYYSDSSDDDEPPLLNGKSSKYGLKFDGKKRHENNLSNHLCILLVSSSESGEKNHLLLEATGIRGQYQRVGLFRALASELIDVLKDEDVLSEDLYEEYLGRNENDAPRYVFTFI